MDEVDGATDETGIVLGTYLYGLFANDTVRRALLEHLAARQSVAPDPRWDEPASARAVR